MSAGPTHLAVAVSPVAGEMYKPQMIMACGVSLGERYEHADWNGALQRVTCPKCAVAWDSALERSANHSHDAVRLLAKEARFT